MRDIMGIYGTVLMTLILLGTQGLVQVPKGMYEMLIGLYVALSSHEDGWVIHVPKSKINQFCVRNFIVPFILIWGYSMIVQFIRGLGTDYLKFTTTVCMRFEIYMIFMITSCKMFGERALKQLMVACIAAYLPAMAKHFSTYGLLKGVYFLFSESAYGASADLEIHTLTYIIGFVTVYFFYRWWISRDNVRNEFLLCFVLTFLGLKRIVMAAVLAAIIVTIVIGWTRGLPQERRRKWVLAGSICMTVIALVYIQMIHSGLIGYLFSEYGIVDNYRLNFWSFFSDHYSITPKFLGYGISYAARVMFNEWRNIAGLGAATNIHNDILSFYLGLGFFGSILYWALFFYGRAKSIWTNFSWQSACFAFIISAYYFICMMTSNEGLVPFTHSVYFVTILAMIRRDEALLQGGETG